MARIHVGLSGYSYKPWQGPGRFYPTDLQQTEFLRFYASRYDSVELDGIWYRLPSEQAVQTWIAHTPPHFVFSPKAHRRITHFQRLKPEAWPFLQTMFDRLAPLEQAKKLGPVLVQLPPNFMRDDHRLEAFLDHLPATVRCAIEFRHPSWMTQTVEDILRGHGVAWAAVETDEQAAEHRNTADFLYARLRRSRYKDADLVEWGTRLEEAAGQGKDCFIYCKHEDEGAPWEWADRLLELTQLRRNL
ncbi:MAG: DUF72 domain-containing protein [Nitrospiraceae bacterium]